MTAYQLTHGFHVAAPDRIRHAACQYQPGPARQSVAAGQRQLRMRKPGFAGFRWFGMMLAQLRNRSSIAGVDLAQQVFGLVFELIEVGENRKMQIGHYGPPWSLPGVRWFGRKGG